MSATIWVVLIAALLLLFVGWRRWKGDFTHLTVAPLMAGALLLSVAATYPAWNDGKDSEAVANPSPTASAKHCDTWAIEKGDYGDTRWFADGVKQIKEAKTEAEARAAVDVWLNRVKKVPLLLQSAVKTFLKEDVPQVDLVDNGCASEKAVRMVLDIQTKVAEAKEVSTEDSAPADSYTTGVEDGRMVSFATTGHDRAVKIVLSSGETIWIESDCGNVVTEKRIFKRSKHKPQPKPKPTPTPTKPPVHRCPWPLTNGKCLQPKNPSQDVSQNDDVADWKKDGDDRHEVDEDSDGASDPNGRQDDPRGDAEDAKEEAEEETEQREEDHEEESSDDVVVDEEQDHSGDSEADW